LEITFQSNIAADHIFQEVTVFICLGWVIKLLWQVIVEHVL